MNRIKQGFKFKVTLQVVTVWGKVLYASTLQSAQSMARFYAKTHENPYAMVEPL